MLLKLDNVYKEYCLGDNLIKALDGVSLEVEEGEFLAIMGPSGSGKSTFLQVASNLASPTRGEIYFKGKNVAHYNEVEQARLRNQEIGFIFQAFNLLPRTSSLDNVALPLMYRGVESEERDRVAQKMLEKVGLGDRLANTPSQLSGGQQQRVAIARALVNNPSIIFADEPTGNLDSKSGTEVEKILKDLHKEGKTIIMVTHDEETGHIAERLIHFKDGKILSDSKTKKKTKTKKKVVKKKK
jgi:putative ABC transport system ATP-binding protein